MSKAASFPAKTVVDSFLYCERMLTDVLRVVPYCDGHKEVWSPVLTTVIMESCSQLDSLWGHTAERSPCVTKTEFNITDYFGYFRSQPLTPLPKRWVVFWGEDVIQLHPFQQWDGVSTYEPLDWWQTYNKLKHDRLANKEKATLSAAVDAMAGLFLAILANEYCSYAAEAAGWLSASDAIAYNPKPSLGEDSPSVKDNYVAAESRLFAYPVGWCTQAVKQTDLWQGNASFRFRHWFEEYATV